MCIKSGVNLGVGGCEGLGCESRNEYKSSISAIL